MAPLTRYGGTPDGTSEFFTGLLMMCIGGYLILDNIMVSNGFSFGRSTFGLQFGTYGVPSGSLFLPMAFGIVMIFKNAKSPFGWILCLGSMAALVASVIMSTTLTFRPVSLWYMSLLMVTFFGGLGLFLKSLKSG